MGYLIRLEAGFDPFPQCLFFHGYFYGYFHGYFRYGGLSQGYHFYHSKECSHTLVSLVR